MRRLLQVNRRHSGLMRAALLIALTGFGAMAQAQTTAAPKPPVTTPSAQPQPAPDPALDKKIAVMRALDKITGKTATFEAKVGATVTFERLEIVVRRCQESPPSRIFEQAAFLQIFEKKAKTEQRQRVFSGWMFASNPALSAMDHPTYDVWLLSCKNASNSSADKSTGK